MIGGQDQDDVMFRFVQVNLYGMQFKKSAIVIAI